MQQRVGALSSGSFYWTQGREEHNHEELDKALLTAVNDILKSRKGMLDVNWRTQIEYFKRQTRVTSLYVQRKKVYSSR